METKNIYTVKIVYWYKLLKSIVMKKQNYFNVNVSRLIIGTMILGLVSCEQNLEVLDDYHETSETVVNTRSASVNDSIILYSNADSLQKPQTRAYSYYPETDEYYSSNMWAVRELPFALKVRGGGTTGRPYFATQGTRKELYLSSSNNSKFYLRILPATSGIPYLIYSDTYKKPLVCGQYSNNPNNKLVFVWDTEDISAGSWDLIPSTYKGYFAIENQTYLGTADPNNPWSVFCYSIEAKSNGQVGYAQYSKKAQQEFLLEFVNGFNVKEIAFDSKSAVVTPMEPIEIESSGQTAPVLGPSNITIYAKKNVKDTSTYSEKGSLKIPMSNPNQLFFRPAVIAGEFINPGNFSSGEAADSTVFMPKAPYAPSTMCEIPKTLSVTIPVSVNEPSLVKVTTYLKRYSVKADYTITMVHKKSGETNEREVKFKGTWNGIIHTTSKAKADKIVIKPMEEEFRLRLLEKQKINKNK